MNVIIDVNKAIRDSMQTEKDAMDFYKYGALKMDDSRAKGTFEMLARDERQHARSFYSLLQDPGLIPFEDFISRPPDTESSWFKALRDHLMADFDERKALELAIEQEELLEKNLRETAARIDNPKVKSVYLANADSTHHHEVLIEEQYHAMLGMSE